jgi:predicted methyltransferase
MTRTDYTFGISSLINLECTIMQARLYSLPLILVASSLLTSAYADHHEPSVSIEAAVSNAERPDDDTARDSQRKPAQILEFFGIQEGQQVLDMYSGGGYYTEILSYAVGDSGRVVAHNNNVYAGMTAEDRTSRYADGRLANVEELIAANNALDLPDDSFDVVLLVLSYHDVYYMDGNRGWEKVDREALLSEVFAAMRSGGVVGVVEHIAAADTDPAVIAGLHRLDPELIKQDFVAAGFELNAESDILQNADDDLGLIPMLPQNRGRSSRAVLRFVKP